MKKIISVFLSALMMLSVMSMSVNALTSGSGVGYIDGINIVDYDPTSYIEPIKEQNHSFNYEVEKFYASSNADTPYMLYSFLNNNQKAVYDAVKSNPVSSEYSVDFPDPITFTTTSFSVTKEVEDECVAACAGGLSAVADDYPMIFWISGFNMQYKYDYTMSGSTYNFTIYGLEIFPSFNTSAYSDLSSVQATYNNMKNVVDSIEIKGFTRYEQVKFIHDFIAKRVVYDPNLGKTGENPTDHEPTSVFLEPYITVCEGYAEAFKILCNKAGIPCVVVVGLGNGGGHAWNYVKMEDNNWYAVDCTWDDQGIIYYDWFLVGTASYNNFGDDTNFGQNHVNTGKRYPDVTFSLTYPSISLSAYSRMMLSGNSGATVSKLKSRIFIEPGTATLGQIECTKGYAGTATGNKTGSTLTIKNTSNITVETYTVIMWGDVVPNAVADATDYQKIKDTTVGISGSLTSGTSEYAAGDLNSDGVVDAFDTALYDLKYNK